LISGFQVTVENVGDVFFETQCVYIFVCVWMWTFILSCLGC